MRSNIIFYIDTTRLPLHPYYITTPQYLNTCNPFRLRRASLA